MTATRTRTPIDKAARDFANYLRSKDTAFDAVGHGTLDGEEVIYLYGDEFDGWTGSYGGYGVIGEKAEENNM